MTQREAATPRYIDLALGGLSGGALVRLREDGYPIRYADEALKRHLGYDELSGDFAALVAAEDLAAARDRFEGPTERYSALYRLRRADGEYVWLRETGRRALDQDGREILVGLLTEADELARSLKRLEASNREYSEITEAIPGGICRLAADEILTIVYANEYFFRLFGYTTEEAKVIGFDSISFVAYSMDLLLLKRDLRRHLENRRPRFEVEVRGVGRTGEIVWVLMRCRYSAEKGVITAVLVDITSRKRAEERLRISEEGYRIAIQHTGKSVFRYDVATRTLLMPEDAVGGLGLPSVLADAPESLIRQGRVDAESAVVLRELFAALGRGEPRGSCVVRFSDPGEAPRWYCVDYTAIFDVERRPIQAIVSFEDITEQREKELAYEKWRQSYGAMPVCSVCYVEYNLTRELLERQEGGLLLGAGPVRRADLILPCAESSVYYEDRERFFDFISRERMLAHYMSGIRELRLEYRRLDEEKRPLWTEVSVQLLPDPYSNDAKVCALFKDIDEQKRKEIALRDAMHIDQLTGLLNRATFIERVAELLAGEGREARHAIIMVDIDNFKHLNDTLGHIFGDKVLRELATSLKKTLRAHDIVGRLGGDELMICMVNAPHQEILEKRCAFFCELLSRQFGDDGRVSASMGVALYREDGQNFEELYQMADIALYEAKKQGKNKFVFYEPRMSLDAYVPINNTPIDAVAREQERAVVREANDDAEAVLNREFVVYLQPIVDIQNSGRIVGAEALVRWDKPGLGIVPPGEFMRRFEKSGGVVELDYYVFEEICRYTRKRLDEGRAPLHISVNVSRVTALKPDFLTRYVALRDQYRIPPRFLALEFSETTVVENPSILLHTVADLREKGFLFALDDFGSSYSSINLFRDVVVDELKLDMLFLREGIEESRRKAILANIISMGRDLHMRVVAEGVELQEQLLSLKELGCDLAQGYLFSRPVEIEEFDRLDREAEWGNG